MTITFYLPSPAIIPTSPKHPPLQTCRFSPQLPPADSIAKHQSLPLLTFYRQTQKPFTSHIQTKLGHRLSSSPATPTRSPIHPFGLPSHLSGLPSYLSGLPSHLSASGSSLLIITPKTRVSSLKMPKTSSTTLSEKDQQMIALFILKTREKNVSYYPLGAFGPTLHQPRHYSIATQSLPSNTR